MGPSADAVRLLVFNAGSSSLKFELVELGRAPARRVAAGSYAVVDGSGLLRWIGPAPGGVAAQAPQPPVARTLAEAADHALDWLANAAVHGRDLAAELDATAHRIVHGGERFRAATRLGDTELAALAALGTLAPLHNPPALAVVDAVRRRLPADRPLVGVFDTAYYADLPAAAWRYAVPAQWTEELGVRRYGFHGIAHRYLCAEARAHHHGSDGNSIRIISLQLGRGCSVTATIGTRAVATSMGFTPLEGLVMGTRSGDIDPGALLYVLERTGMSVAAMRRALNEESGLLALSGRSADMRELLELESAGDPAAALAIECFCRRARHYVGGFLAELGGADVIVFGGGIGENCPGIRRRIVGNLEWAGIRLRGDDDVSVTGADRAAADGMHDPSSRTAVYVVPVDEAAVIAADAYTVLQGGVAL